VRLESGRGGAVAAYSSERRSVSSGVARRKKGEQARMQGLGSGFIATGRSVEEKGRGCMHLASFKATGSAGGISGERGSCSGSTAQRGSARGGQRGRRWRWEEWWGDAWNKIRPVQSCRGLGSNRRQRAEEIGAGGGR
jgi:hypothetical protein